MNELDKHQNSARVNWFVAFLLHTVNTQQLNSYTRKTKFVINKTKSKNYVLFSVLFSKIEYKFSANRIFRVVL